MALLWMDSFDTYATADLAAKYTIANGLIAAGQGRRGTACLQGSTGPTLAFPASTAACISGAAVKPASFSGACKIFGLYLGSGNAQVSLLNNVSGFLEVRRGDYVGTLLGTAVSNPLSTAAFAFVEWKVVVHPSAGSVTAYVNGVAVITLTGINTAQTGSAGWDRMQLAGGAGSCSFDDWYVLDDTGAAPLNAVLGDVRVDARVPTAAGATTGFTPSTGANWQNVDDATPNGDTDFNSTLSVPATDTFTVQDAPVAGATLYGVQVSINAKKLDAGTCSLAPVVRHAGTDNVGADVALSTNYLYFTKVFGTNPGTGAAWVEADFNAAEFGYKRTA